jgi:hypothetical protein
MHFFVLFAGYFCRPIIGILSRILFLVELYQRVTIGCRSSNRNLEFVIYLWTVISTAGLPFAPCNIMHLQQLNRFVLGFVFALQSIPISLAISVFFMDLTSSLIFFSFEVNVNTYLIQITLHIPAASQNVES